MINRQGFFHRFTATHGCALALLWAASFSVHANAPWHNAQAGQMFSRAQQGQPWLQSVHLRSDVKVQVSGMVVEVDYRQTFTNDSDEWREAIYVLPLAEQAAVHHLSMTIGEREIVGQIREKAQAQKLYLQAKQAGKKAALLQQQRPNLFTQKIANIAPGEQVSIQIKYLETAQFSAGTFSWRLPTTLTPRYMPGSPLTPTQEVGPSASSTKVAATEFEVSGWSMPTSQVADAPWISPWMKPRADAAVDNPLTIAVTLAAGLPLAHVTALYHDIHINKVAQSHQIRLRDGAVAMDRDFVLQWRPVAKSMPSAALFKQQYQGEDYAMLMVLPPAGAEQDALARDLVFVLDTSGSMQGPSMAQAQAALVRGIERLGENDRFDIIEFNSVQRPLFNGLREANALNKQQALAWVGALQAGGGTEMLPALNAAFDTLNSDSLNLKQLVFITDGAVGNEEQLFRSIHQQLGDSRLFTVGIGSAPNSFFMRKAAHFGRGTFTYIGAAEQVAERMDQLLRKLGSALTSNVQLSWPVAAEQYPQRVPDIYQGEPLTVFIKTPALSGHAVVAGETAGAQPWQQSLNLQTLAASPDSPGIARLWARQKIDALRDQQYTGADQGLRDQILTLGLAHQLLTPYTSFVAVEQKVSRPADERLAPTAVPNVVAKGQVPQPQAMPMAHAQSIAFPATATSLRLSLYLGLLASCLVLTLVLLPVGKLRGGRRELA